MTATDQARNYIATLPNKHLAHALLDSILASGPLGPLHDLLRTEAHNRAGDIARDQEAADNEAFRARYGITEDWTLDQLDDIFDALADHERTPGGVYYLAAALTRDNAWDIRNAHLDLPAPTN